MVSSRLDTTVAVARALGHSARLRICAMLRAGDLCVCQITEVLKLAPSTVSIHLRELKRSGLIEERKDGRWVHIALAQEPQARSWIGTALAAIDGDAQIDADRGMVAKLRRVTVEDLCRYGYEQARARNDNRQPGKWSARGRKATQAQQQRRSRATAS